MALHHHRMLEDERRPWPQSHCRFGRCPSWPPLVAASGCSRKLRRSRCLHGDGKLGVPIISVALCNRRQPKNQMIGVQHRRPIPGDSIYVKTRNDSCQGKKLPSVGFGQAGPIAPLPVPQRDMVRKGSGPHPLGGAQMDPVLHGLEDLRACIDRQLDVYKN